MMNNDEEARIAFRKMIDNVKAAGPTIPNLVLAAEQERAIQWMKNVGVDITDRTEVITVVGISTGDFPGPVKGMMRTIFALGYVLGEFEAKQKNEVH